jgi:hypothetical protein
MVRELLRHWADYDNEQPAGWLKDDWESRADPAVLDRAAAFTADAASNSNAGDDVIGAAHRSLEPIIARGLMRREGRFVRPPVVVKPATRPATSSLPSSFCCGGARIAGDAARDRGG